MHKSDSKFSALCCSAASMWHPNMLLFGIESLSRNILCNHKIDMYSYFLATFFMYHVIKLNTRTWNHSSVPIGSYFWQLFWHFLKILRFNLYSGNSVLHCKGGRYLKEMIFKRERGSPFSYDFGWGLVTTQLYITYLISSITTLVIATSLTFTFSL